MYPKVVIIILNWNGKQDSLECLHSVRQLTYPNYDVLFIDNGSQDDSVACISQAFSDIQIIVNTKNLGFAEGNNVGIQKALEEKADYIFLLNNDTVVDCNLLNALVEAGEKTPEAGIFGGKMYYLEPPDCFYSAGASINFREFLVKPRGYKQKDQGQFDQVAEVDFIIGCGLLIKRQVIEDIGFLDPLYFAYFEDVDWCARARAKGYKILYIPESRMWHRVAASTGGTNNPRWNYLMGRGAVIFMKKYGNLWNWLKFLSFLSAECVWGLLKNIFCTPRKPLLAKLRGVRDGFFLKDVNLDI